MEEINGLHPGKLEGLINALQEPEARKAISGPWRARVVWESGFKAKAYSRAHTVDFDEPAELDTNDTSSSAHESVLSTVGACMTVGFVLNATRQRIKIHNLEISLEGHFDNIRKWVGLTKKGNPGYRLITAKRYVSADANEATLREIWKKAVDASPVTQTVMRPTPITTDFEMV